MGMRLRARTVRTREELRAAISEARPVEGAIPLLVLDARLYLER